MMRWSDKKRLATTLALALALLCVAITWAGGSAAGAAPATGDLTLSISSLDLTHYPTASAIVQLGGSLATTLGTLGPESFTLLVDGESTATGQLQEAATGQTLPVQTVLLVDESGSMKGEAASAAGTAAARFISVMRAGDVAAVEAFNEGFRSLQPFSGDKTALSDSLKGLAPQKETALYDALLQSLTSFGAAPEGGARYLILLSDGGDTASKATLDQAITAVRASTVQVYTIGLKTKEFDSQPLVSIAQASGGRYLETPDPDALTSLYENLAKEIHNQYVLTFGLNQAIQHQATGNLIIQVTAAGATAQAERGFFYPAVAVTTTTTTSPVPTTVAGGEEVAPVSSPGLVSRFLDWKYSDYVLGVLIFVIFFALLFTVSGIVFPRRDVLTEYSDLLENRRRLGPRALDEEHAKLGFAQRAAQRMLSVRGYQQPLQRLIDDAALKFKASEFALLHFIGVAVVVIVMLVLHVPIAFVVVAGLIVVFAPLAFLSLKGKGRRDAFEAQVPNTLTLLAGSLRAGQGLEQAIALTAGEAPEPTSSELKKVLAQQRLGVAPEEALRSVAQNMQSDAFDWAVMTTIIQRQVGGNLAEIYEATARTLRERAKLRREIKTLTAEGRLSAIILIILPFAIATLVAIVNRGYLKPLYTTTVGLVMLGLGFVLMCIGILWMRTIIRLDV